MLSDSDKYLQRFVDFVATQDFVENLSLEDLARTKRREDLGISSLNVILLIANYMEQTGKDDLEFKPAWVALLDDVDGIVAVLREIDLHGSGSMAQAVPAAIGGSVDPDRSWD